MSSYMFTALWRLALLLSIFQQSCAGSASPSLFRKDQVKRQTNVPSFVLDYAPIAYLDEEEQYFPSDIATHLTHMTPRINNVTVEGSPDPLTLENLDQLNALNGSNIYLTSNEGIQALPGYFTGIKPDEAGKVSGGTSTAVIVADKGDHVDVFYFYFYTYNRGNDVDIIGVINLGDYGDHVGDWEHVMVRFKNSTPDSLWLSQHASGEAFTYGAMEKFNNGTRPVVYIGRGTHANWAKPGSHDHTLGINLPVDFLLTDQTSKGFLFDPMQSAYFFTYNNASKAFAAYDEITSSAWLNFLGKWGDAQLPDDYPGQKILFGNAKYSGGPTGPYDKHLDRVDVCNPGSVDTCIVSPILLSKE